MILLFQTVEPNLTPPSLIKTKGSDKTGSPKTDSLGGVAGKVGDVLAPQSPEDIAQVAQKAADKAFGGVANVAINISSPASSELKQFLNDSMSTRPAGQAKITITREDTDGDQIPDRETVTAEGENVTYDAKTGWLTADGESQVGMVDNGHGEVEGGGFGYSEGYGETDNKELRPPPKGADVGKIGESGQDTLVKKVKTEFSSPPVNILNPEAQAVADKLKDQQIEKEASKATKK